MDEKGASFIRALVSQSGERAGRAMQKATDIKSVEPSGACPRCGGSGWRYLEESRDKRVVRCDCYFETQGRRLLEVANIPARYSRCDFSNYRTDNNTFLAKAKFDIESWASQYPLDRTGLLLLGMSGVGKTHLASAALKVLTSKGFHCLFVDYRDLLKQIQNSYNPSVETTELQLLRPVFETEVVLLDDLGAIKPSEWVWDTVSLILNNRYNENRTTLITSNFLDGPAAGVEEAEESGTGKRDDSEQAARGLGPKQRNGPTLGDRIGNRMRSRLFEMCRPVLVIGSDYRMKLRAVNSR